MTEPTPTPGPRCRRSSHPVRNTASPDASTCSPACWGAQAHPNLWPSLPETYRLEFASEPREPHLLSIFMPFLYLSSSLSCAVNFVAASSTFAPRSTKLLIWIPTSFFSSGGCSSSVSKTISCAFDPMLFTTLIGMSPQYTSMGPVRSSATKNFNPAIFSALAASTTFLLVIESSLSSTSLTVYSVAGMFAEASSIYKMKAAAANNMNPRFLILGLSDQYFHSGCATPQRH